MGGASSARTLNIGVRTAGCGPRALNIGVVQSVQLELSSSANASSYSTVPYSNLLLIALHRYNIKFIFNHFIVEILD